LEMKLSVACLIVGSVLLYVAWSEPPDVVADLDGVEPGSVVELEGCVVGHAVRAGGESLTLYTGRSYVPVYVEGTVGVRKGDTVDVVGRVTVYRGVREVRVPSPEAVRVVSGPYRVRGGVGVRDLRLVR